MGSHATSLATQPHNVPPTPPQEYQETPAGITWKKPGGKEVPLCNFTCRIVADMVYDDGVEKRREIELEVHFDGEIFSFNLPGHRFAAMTWPIEYVGPGAIINPGHAQRVMVAIQALSGNIPTHTVHQNTGWTDVNGSPVYLHAEGGIGADGPVQDVSVAVAESASRFVLPSVSGSKDLCKAVLASLKMLMLGPLAVMAILYGTIWRTVLGRVDFTPHLVGPSGSGKTAVAALVQQHWGSGNDAGHLPASWSSTENALEAIGFYLKDAICTIDDFAPSGGGNDIHSLNAKADRVLRAQGNQSGRARMRSDLSVVPPKPPRGCFLSTGEDIPRIYSLQARMVIIEIDDSSLDWPLMSECQKDADSGLYSLAMSGYVQWVAQDYNKIQENLPKRVQRYRDKLNGPHRRNATTTANLMVGLDYFLEFAVEIGAIPDFDTELKQKEWHEALLQVTEDQVKFHEGVEPTVRYIELLSAAFDSGRAHVCSINGSEPTNPSAWGWRNGNNGRHPRGTQIGWVDGDDLFLIPVAAYQTANEMARNGAGISISEQTLRKRLHEKDFLLSTEKDGRKTLTIRKTLDGARRPVLHLSSKTIVSPD
jgi:hypothetical protein